MDSPPPAPVVGTDWLAARLQQPGLVVLDASWYLPTAGRDARDEYLVGHIPGARFFDLDAASDPSTALPHMLPSAERFAEYVGALGISNRHQVVVYDGSGANLSAARAWWMFRAFGHQAVAVLDGGLGRWRAQGLPLEAGEARADPAVFEAVLQPGRVVALDEVEAVLADRTAQVVDLRPAGRFRGNDPEPRPGLPSGHMPGAVSLPYGTLVRSDGTLLDEATTRRVLEAAGVRLDHPVIATCGSGTSACNLLLALERLGLPPGRLYDGSWTEWAGRGRPAERGG